MTDSVSDLSAGDSSNSLREGAFGASTNAPDSTSQGSAQGSVSKTSSSNEPNQKLFEQSSPPPDPISDSQFPSTDATGSQAGSGFGQPLSSGEISPDEMTVITQLPNVGDAKATISSLEGRLIGNFELKQFLGGGGMGIVFRAFDSVLSRSVAIKLLPRAGTKSETIQRFQVEARSAARLDHPNISRVFQVGSDDACDYIVFEFVEGDNLSQLVRRIGPLPYDLALRYTFQLALAIQHAYQRGVVHRDIKPANVVVTDGGKLKLIDLGLARSPKSNDDNSLTATGVMLGTYDYLSPEQAKDSRSADVRSDLYSLGCTVFFMLAGQPPYPQGTPIEKIIQHSSEKRPRPSDYRADLPSGFDTITSKLLAIDPNDRYQRPAELIADIQELATRNNIPLLGYDDNVVVKKIITRPSWTMQLVPVLVPIILLIGFVFYLDWSDRISEENRLKTGSNSFGQNELIDNRGGGSNLSSSKDKKSGGISSPKKDSKSPGKSESANSTKGRKDSSKDDETNGTKGSRSGKGGAANTTPPTFITVGATDPPAEGATNFDDLDTALEAVNNDPRLTEIKLYRDSILLTKPISVKVNQKLTISSAGNNECMVLFRPLGVYKSSYFRVRGGDVEFQNVHFRLEVDPEMQPENSRQNSVVTLFELEAVKNASFDDCSLTIDNFDDDGQKILPKARFFSLTPPRKNSAMFDIQPTESTAAKPSITLRNSCMRGEADLIHLTESFPVTISLTNGLCVTDGSVIDLGSPKDDPSNNQSEIEVYLTKFTSISSGGFAKVDAGISYPPIPVRIVAKQSIFNYGTNNSFILHQNLANDTAKDRVLLLKCQDSFFPQRNPLWILRYQDNPDVDETLDFNAMGDWLDSTGTVGDTDQVTWQKLDGFSIPPSEHTVFDYKLSGPFEKNPAIRREAGLDPDGFLPIPPAFIE